jgi:hypothetical protein
LAFFSIFAAVASDEAAHAMSSCGCFGNLKIPPLLTAILDLSAVGALWWAWSRERRISISTPIMSRVLAGLALLIFLSGVLWTVYAFRFVVSVAAVSSPLAAANDLVILDSTSWLNKPFPLLSSIDGADELRSGRWYLLMYHYDCDSCLEAILNYRSFASAQDARSRYRVAFIAMPPLPPPGKDPVPPSDRYLHLILRPDHDWFATTPVIVELDNGLVTFAAEGDKAVHPPNQPQ